MVAAFAGNWTLVIQPVTEMAQLSWLQQTAKIWKVMKGYVTLHSSMSYSQATKLTSTYNMKWRFQWQHATCSLQWHLKFVTINTLHCLNQWTQQCVKEAETCLYFCNNDAFLWNSCAETWRTKWWDGIQRMQQQKTKTGSESSVGECHP